MVAVYFVLANKLFNGLNVAELPNDVTVPETKDVPCINVNVAVLMYAESISSLNVTTMLWLNGTFTAALTGLVEITVGLVKIGDEVSLSLSSQLTINKIASMGISHILK